VYYGTDAQIPCMFFCSHSIDKLRVEFDQTRWLTMYLSTPIKCMLLLSYLPRVAQFLELPINSLFFQKSWLEGSGFLAYSFLIPGYLQPGFWENHGIY
jgi:hypothetical protein